MMHRPRFAIPSFRPPSQPVTLAAVGLATGIAVASTIPPSLDDRLVAAGLLVLTGITLAPRFAARRRAGGSLSLSVVVFGAFLSFGVVRGRFPDVAITGGATLPPGALVRVEGTLAESILPIPPRPIDVGGFTRRPTTSRVDLVDATVDLGGGWTKPGGRVALLLPRPTRPLWRGERIGATGEFLRSTPPRNPGERDRRLRDRRESVSLTIAVPSEKLLVRLAPATRSWHLEVDRLRVKIWAYLWSVLPPREAPLAAALAIGWRRDLSDELRSAAAETGLLHLLAISGLHIGVVVGGLRALLGLILPPRAADLLAVAAAILYATIAGGAAPILRASIGLAMILIGRAMCRYPHPLTPLALAVILLLSYDPAELFRPGFQLSVAAVAGLVTATRRSREATTGRFGRSSGLVRDALATSLRASLFTAPVLWFHFGVVTPLGPLFTLLCAPLFLVTFWLVVPLAFLGPFVPLFTWLAFPVATTLAWLATFFELAQRVPGSLLLIPRLPPVAIAALFGAIVRRRSRWQSAILLSIGITVGVFHFLPPRSVELWVFDVGHGQAVLLRTPSGRNLLFDAGSRGAIDPGRRLLLPALDAIGVPRVDVAFLSHGDSDHTNALGALLAAGRVREVIHGVAIERSLTNERWRSVAREHRVPVRPANPSGEVRRIDPSVLVTLAPTAVDASLPDNDRSLVVEIAIDGTSLILPGDLEESGIEHFLASNPPPTDLLLLPHHGNPSPWHAPLLHRLHPSIVVASRAAPLPHDHIPPLCRRIGAQLLTTYDGGCLTVRIRNDGTLRAERFVQERPP